MKILLFGKNGQVGHELNNRLSGSGEVIALGRKEADFSNPESLRIIIQQEKPDVIVNAAAYTAVDKAEDEEELAHLINGVSPGVLAEEAAKLNALLVHYSTDYVFDGTKNTPYLETDEPNPINVYGRTKFEGERAIQSSGCDYLILRTSWVYSTRGSNFLLSILRLASEREELNIVDDQIGSPTWAGYIAERTALIISESQKQRLKDEFSSGIYNLTSSGSTSWYGFAQEIVKKASLLALGEGFVVKQIHPIPSSQYKTPAKRPYYSVLSTDKLESRFCISSVEWKAALDSCMNSVK